MIEIFPTAKDNGDRWEIANLTVRQFRVLRSTLPELLQLFLDNPQSPLKLVACWEDWDEPSEWWVLVDEAE